MNDGDPSPEFVSRFSLFSNNIYIFWHAYAMGLFIAKAVFPVYSKSAIWIRYRTPHGGSASETKTATSDACYGNIGSTRNGNIFWMIGLLNRKVPFFSAKLVFFTWVMGLFIGVHYRFTLLVSHFLCEVLIVLIVLRSSSGYEPRITHMVHLRRGMCLEFKASAKLTLRTTETATGRPTTRPGLQ